MEALLTKELTEDQVRKLRKYEREKRIRAFQIVFEMHKETIGEWEITDYQDAGENWRKVSKLKCECGRTLRYRYTVTNRNTAEIINFGINHLKEHTNFSDDVLREINKQLNAARKEVEEIELRLKEDWKLDIEIPETVIIPDSIKRMLNDGLPLSKSDESHLSSLLQDAYNEKWETSTTTTKDIEDLDRNYTIKRVAPKSGFYDLWEHEQQFMNDMLYLGVGSAMIIAEQLRKSINQYIMQTFI